MAAGLALSGASAFAGHGWSTFVVSAESFVVKPAAVDETTFPQFTAGAIDFSYTAEVDQIGGAAGGAGSTVSSKARGAVRFGAILTGGASASLGAGDTGLNLDSTTPVRAVRRRRYRDGDERRWRRGTFTSFNVTFFVDRGNDATFGFVAGDDFGNRRGTTGGTADDTSVLTAACSSVASSPSAAWPAATST